VLGWLVGSMRILLVKAKIRILEKIVGLMLEWLSFFSFVLPQYAINNICNSQ
jgi:hypothetical protein